MPSARSRLGEGLSLDQFGGGGYRSTGYGFGGGGRGSAPGYLPRSYYPGGSARVSPQQYRPQLAPRGRPISGPQMRPPVRQPQISPQEPLPKGFNRLPAQGRPTTRGIPQGNLPKGTTPYRATPKGFGQPRPQTPPPQPQKPPQFDPFKVEPVKPAIPYYKPIPRPFGPGGFPASYPSPNTPPQYRDPTGKNAPDDRSAPFGDMSPDQRPVREVFGIPLGHTYGISGYFRGLTGSVESRPPQYLSSTFGGDVRLSVEFLYEYIPDYFNPDLKLWVWACYTHWRNGRGTLIKGFTTEVSTLKNNRPFYAITGIDCLDCAPGTPDPSIKPYKPAPPFAAAPPTIAPPPVQIPDTIPPNLPDIYPGLPDPEYPDPPEDEPQPPDPIEPDPEPVEPDPKLPSPIGPEPHPDTNEPTLPPPIDPDPFGDEPDFPGTVPSPAPDPEPTPDPTPTPTPTPDPKPIPLPVPIPIPGPDPSPDIRPAPDPKPIPLPVPIPIPGPTPSPDVRPAPDPKPIPLPVPIPIPGPTPSPDVRPAPDPKPIPLPVPIPIPGPDPGPTPSPDPKPRPIPGDPGTPIGPSDPGDGDPKPPGDPGVPFPDDFRPRPWRPDPPPIGPPAPPPIPPVPPVPPAPPPFFDDQPKEPNPMDDFSPPDFIPMPKSPPTGKCKNDACLISIEGAAQGAKDAASKGLDKLEKLLETLQPLIQVLDTSLLVIINDKLGPKLPGGLSKFIERIDKTTKLITSITTGIAEKLGSVSKWLRLGQLMSVLTFIGVLHNALMLSRSVGETFLSMVSNGLAVFGIKDDGGNPYDLSSLIGKSVEETVKTVIGNENYTNLSANYKKANRIYQAAANLGNSIQALRFSVISALETVGGWNARIGNALKKYGVLGDSAYPWMNPSPNFDNRFMRGLETVENAVSQIDSVASEVLSAQETVAEIGRQKTELAAAIKDGTEKPGVDNAQQKATATATKTASKSPDLVGDNFVKPEG
jgi:hypothetical protein